MEKGTVLVVEDDEDLAKVWRRNLEGKGYLVESYEDSRDVHDRLDEENGIVAAILDYHLPGSPGSGLSILQDLRHRDEYHSIPVVMVSGDWPSDVREEAEHRLGARCLDKPGSSPTELIRSLLEAREWASLRADIRTIRDRPHLTEVKVIALIHDHAIPALMSRAPRHVLELLGGWRRLTGAILAGCVGLVTGAYYLGAGTGIVDAARKALGW